MVKRTAAVHKGIPTTENPRKRPQVNARTTGKDSGQPPKKLSPLDEKKRLAILTGIFMIIQSGNLFLKLTSIYPCRKTSKNISHWTGN